MPDPQTPDQTVEILVDGLPVTPGAPLPISGTIIVNAGAIQVADGDDVNAGSTTDPAETSDSDGTLSGKLRGLVKWAYERMPTSLGQKLMAASFPVVLASDQSTIPVSAASLPLPTGAATLAEQQSQTTALQLIDDIVESGRAKVNPIVGQTGVQAGAGATTANTQRMVIANDAGTLGNGAQTAVSSAAVQVLASNSSRKSAIIQNVGAENVRIGVSGVTATTGLQLKPGGVLTLSMPYVHTGAVFAIRESADSIVLAQEIT